MTVAVCLKCGAMKLGALTSCPKCRYVPEDLEDKAKHVMVSDHHFSKAELESFSATMQSGQPLQFNAEQVEHFIAAYEIAEAEGNKPGWFILGRFATIAIVMVAVIVLVVLALRCVR
jgi:hypothetical protein